MNNFEFYNPVRILFGKGQIASIPAHLPDGCKVLWLYGSGSIKKNGVYEQVKEILEGFDWIEFSGVRPNPMYEDLMPAVKLAREKCIDFILATGGGSVIDAAKFIAAAAPYTGEDPWELLSDQVEVKQAIPIGTVLTLPATGSEMNWNSVISRESTGQKLPFRSHLIMPRFSVLDPEVTFSLPKHQLANGVIDTYVHVMEQYLTYPVHAWVQDRFAESLLQLLKEIGPKIVHAEKPDYDRRANLMWAATQALNSNLSMGVVTDWATHWIGHELTILYGLDHAVTLAIVLPGLMRYVREMRQERMLQYAENILGIHTLDPQTSIEEAIWQTEQFFQSLDVPTKLSDYGIGREAIEKIEDNMRRRGLEYISQAKDLTVNDINAILQPQL